MAEQRDLVRCRQSFDPLGRHQIDDQSNLGRRLEGEIQQSQAAYFEQPLQHLGRSRQHGVTYNFEMNLIVGHQSRAGFDQAERQIGLAGSGSATQQNAMVSPDDTGGMDQAAVIAQDWVASR